MEDTFVAVLLRLRCEWKKHCIDEEAIREILLNEQGKGENLWMERLLKEIERVNEYLKLGEEDLRKRLSLLEDTFHNTFGFRFSDFWLPFSARLESFRFLQVKTFETIRKLFNIANQMTTESKINFRDFVLKQSFYQDIRVDELVTKAEILAIKSFSKNQLFPIHKSSSYQCSICNQLLCNPVSLSCNHRFCWNCISSNLFDSESCPLCDSRDVLQGCFPDWTFSDFINGHFLGGKKSQNALKKPKVLLIGIDGCRPDCLQLAKAPNIKRENMGYSYKAQTNEIPLSGPAWCSAILGVWEKKHSVINNSNPLKPNKEYLPFFAHLKSENPDLKTAAFCSWDPIGKVCEPFIDFIGGDLEDEKTVAMALHQLSQKDCPDVTFIHVDSVDHKGHEYGFDPSIPEYIQAIEKCDEYFKILFDVVESRTNQYLEDWLVIAVTDHGGYLLPEKKDGLLGDHGQNVKEDRTIFVTLYGNSVIEGEIDPSPQIVDVPSTILTFMLDKHPDERWNLDGVPRALKSLNWSPSKLVEKLMSRLHVQEEYVPSPQTILQFTDLHYFNDGSDEDKQGINLINDLVGRIKPNLVILTGDIIDGRFCKSFECFSEIVTPIINHGIPWTYTPGNHDDENEEYERDDMLKILSYPGCISQGVTNWSHSIQFGDVQLYLIDSNAYISQTPKTIYDYIHPEQIAWYSAYPTFGQVGLAFFHIPLPEYKESKILVGNKGENIESPQENSGFFEAAKKKGDISAMFVGHDHWNNFVSDLDNIWLAYGRISGYTSPSVYSSPENASKCPSRGARMIQYDPTKRELSTWEETLEGKVDGSFIMKSIAKKSLLQ